ncbi:nitroreductase/quinone reductase family protein [Baekduia sp. Peel2402]|uniref:nitroreductase/quinone reductase family protein n=1 Tax=Baekduia sp. Peel2402 TaxID=3458296 RepID=UPI00403EAF19
MQRAVASFTHYATQIPILGPAVGRLQAAALRRSRGRVGASWFGARVLVLETIGRRSGIVRQTALIYVPAGEDGAIALLGANAGNDHPPGWWWNLTAAETVDVLVDGERRRMRWREAVGDERSRLFEAFVAAYPPAGHYAEFTDRVLPMAVLTP